jgi:seryl-tRNA synthetase
MSNPVFGIGVVSSLVGQLSLQERQDILVLDDKQPQLLHTHVETKLRHHQAVSQYLDQKEACERQRVSLQQQLEEAQRTNLRLQDEAEHLFSLMSQKIAEVEPLKKQMELFDQQKQPGELARRCRDEITRLKGEETKLNHSAAAVGSSPLWNGTEFSCSDYVNQHVELNTRVGLLLKAESTLLSKQPH